MNRSLEDVNRRSRKWVGSCRSRLLLLHQSVELDRTVTRWDRSFNRRDINFLGQEARLQAARWAVNEA